MTPHKGPAVRSEMAAEVLRHHFSQKPASVKRLHGGQANHVFEAKVGDEEVVVRISRDPAKLQIYLKEQWAVRKARKVDVPAPEILEVGNSAIPNPYMISRKVKGADGTKSPRRIDTARTMGEFAARINSIATSGFGSVFDWSRNELSRNRSWAEFLDQELKAPERLELLEAHNMLRPEALRKLKKCVATLRGWNGAPALTHGDIRLKNLVLDEKGNVLALLDWEDCTSNMAPEWELSIALHDLWIDEMEAFLEGYGMNHKQFADIAEAVKTLNILNHSPAISEAVQAKDKRRLESLRARLHGAMDLHSL